MRESNRWLWVPIIAILIPVAAACTSEREDRARASSEDAASPAIAEEHTRGATRRYSETREPCADYDPLRRALWGELHVHSGDSMDAYMSKVRGTPDDVYRFARGETIRLAPVDAEGRGTRPVQLERPLDFAALTDHASYLGEVALCTRPDSVLYESRACRVFREGDPDARSPIGELGVRISAISKPLLLDQEIPGRLTSLCGEGFETCIAAMDTVWQEQKAAAERHYDRSAACSFTTFHGYEYSATPAMSKVHHNVIYRNANTPDSPIAWVDEPDVYELWQRLRGECLESGTGCDVLTIPHNSNLSSGRMFERQGLELPLSEQRARALLRARLEPIVEISQIKGSSECRNGMYGVVGATDEFCDTVEWGRPVERDCEEGSGSGVLMGLGCTSRTDFVRYTLLEGFREKRRLGVNPYKLGMIAATDAHNANPGDTEEYSFDGWFGTQDDTARKRLALPTSGDPMRGALADSAGGLAGVWAEENSRDAIFDALARRETFGTSGTRLTARFFGGWKFEGDLCDDANLVRTGYDQGVPMGGDLAERPGSAAAPRFVVAAQADPGAEGRPGTSLQRAQIVKGWVDEEGLFRSEVFDVAGGANDADVDLATCTPRGPGHRELCAVWEDPTFDPSTEAVYYVRVLENPSCRWNQFECNALDPSERPEACTKPGIVRTVQERLWTSPIWYAP